MKSKNILLVCAALLSCGAGTLQGVCIKERPLKNQGMYTLRKGHIVNLNDVSTLPVQDHFCLGIDAIEREDWMEASRQFGIVSKNFPTTPYGQEAFYYLGVVEYNLGEYDFANEAFSQYLKVHNNPQFFQKTIEYKYAIAERFKEGARRHLLGTKRLPKWASSTSLALKIYDEVIAAMPCHEMAVQALYSKACFLWEMKEYRESVEAFQTIIRRFPKHEMAPECYVLISEIYCDQSLVEFQNPDILAFAQINFKKFLRDFPKDERVAKVEQDVLAIKEIYAKGLYKTAQFYERKNKPDASIIYYQSAIDQFPETEIARRCKRRLNFLCPQKQTPQATSTEENFEYQETEEHS